VRGYNGPYTFAFTSYKSPICATNNVNGDLNDCTYMCNSTSSCTGFNFNPSLNQCCVHTDDSGPDPHGYSDWVSYKSIFNDEVY
jgi:hypothetical protein